jgi:hypothetical protein
MRSSYRSASDLRAAAAVRLLRMDLATLGLSCEQRRSLAKARAARYLPRWRSIARRGEHNESRAMNVAAPPAARRRTATRPTATNSPQPNGMPVKQIASARHCGGRGMLTRRCGLTISFAVLRATRPVPSERANRAGPGARVRVLPIQVDVELFDSRSRHPSPAHVADAASGGSPCASVACAFAV